MKTGFVRVKDDEMAKQKKADNIAINGEMETQEKHE